MATIADYQGRKFDILAFQPANGTTELSQSLVSSSNGGLICTGIQKLAQRWVLEFLTPAGSIPYKPERGSSFIDNVRSGKIQNNVDVVAYFSAAAAEIATNLKNEDLVTDPADEKYDSASLDGFSLMDDGKLVLEVTVLSAAGTSRNIILPISVTAGLI
jgi:hypothetical protein